MIDIRRVTVDDWQRLRDVRLLSLQDAPDAFGSTYQREAAFDEATWRERAGSRAYFFAVDGDQVVGLSAGVGAADYLQPDERLLMSVYVLPAHRGSGVLDALVAAVADWACSDGGLVLQLDVGVRNPRAKRAYERCGFVSTGRLWNLERDPSIVEETLRLDLRNGSGS
ncbi:MAG: GNAT family N-acetyltransferase [Nakamurella sp.]